MDCYVCCLAQCRSTSTNQKSKSGEVHSPIQIVNHLRPDTGFNRAFSTSAMAVPTPYTYFQCPCTDVLAPPRNRESNHEDEEEDEQTFDPRSPRANYSLYPLDHLLYCEDCHQIRCEKCVLDEIVTYYCPNCLFEVPGSSVKTDGNRCARSCFQCPSCTSPLSVNSLENSVASSLLGADQATPSGPWVLSCLYCNWSSKEIGITFEKPNAIYAQLSKIKNGGERVVSRKESIYERRRQFSTSSIPEIQSPTDTAEEEAEQKPDEHLTHEAQFANLKEFYQSMLSDSTSSNALPFAGDYGFSSPGTLSRIMGLYGTGIGPSDKKSNPRSSAFREAREKSEGLKLSETDDSTTISRLQSEGWEAAVSPEQNSNQLEPCKFASDLRPIPYLLRTKRSKRCRTCRHILSKPESKIQTTRFRIRQVALNYLPRISIRPLQPHSSSRDLLQPLIPIQYVIRLHNPLFEDIKVALLTPSQTPGRFASKVTILCPEFEVGAKKDEWDEALASGSDSRGGAGGERRRTREEASEGQTQAEAGKIWERGRDWTSVVVEIVPASLNLSKQISFLRKDGEDVERGLGEDEDILEIPVFVRLEWETREDHDTSTMSTKEGDKGAKEKHELAYWCVLGVGRIAPDA